MHLRSPSPFPYRNNCATNTCEIALEEYKVVPLFQKRISQLNYLHRKCWMEAEKSKKEKSDPIWGKAAPQGEQKFIETYLESTSCRGRQFLLPIAPETSYDL